MTASWLLRCRKARRDTAISLHLSMLRVDHRLAPLRKLGRKLPCIIMTRLITIASEWIYRGHGGGLSRE